jgi:hypothetical protein
MKRSGEMWSSLVSLIKIVCFMANQKPGMDVNGNYLLNGISLISAAAPGKPSIQTRQTGYWPRQTICG